MKLRNLASSSLLAVSGLFAVAASASEPVLSDQEQLISSYLKSRGVENFVMMSERRGQIMLISGNTIIHSYSALSGSVKGDNKHVNPRVTPAGIFPLSPSDNQSHPKASIAFDQVSVKGEVTDFTIHRVVKAQNRPQRLKSNDPEYKRITNGCINLDSADYDRVSSFVTASRATIASEDGMRHMTASFMVVLPETNDLVKTRGILNIPADFNPR